jgi:hypothetical protein
MSQEPDEYTVNHPPAGPSFDPAYQAPAQPPYRPTGPLHQQQPPPRPGPSAREDLQARLRALREQRQQVEQSQPPPSFEFQRRGLPAPPTPQPPIKDVLKHWWEHGPFSGPLRGPGAAEGQDQSQRQASSGFAPLRRPGRPTGPLSPSGPLSPYQSGAQEPPDARGKTGAFPRRGGPTQPLDERAKELFSQAKNWLNERARQHLEQVAASQSSMSQPPAPQPPPALQPQPSSLPFAPQSPFAPPAVASPEPPGPAGFGQSRLPAAPSRVSAAGGNPIPALSAAPQPELAPEGIVPGLVVIGFASSVSREEGIQLITALGGKPLRYKASLNLFQVAVPPGQERAMIQRFWQQPEVVSAGVERQRPQE